MCAVRERVRRTIRRHALCPPGSRVLVALSGGSDSVALTFLLRDLAPFLEFDIAGVAHFNHRLRDTADRDEQFCRALAERLGLTILVGSGDVKACADRDGLSIEDAARRERYSFLAQAVVELGADRAAAGHTLDDQVETFVLKLVRGAGTTGLGGVYPVRGHVVRPLLETSRAELRNYLDELGETWVEDETNADLQNPRNRVRHVFLPRLDEAFGPSARRAIARAAGLSGDDARWLDQLAEERLTRLVSDTPSGVELDAEQLRAEPLPLARRILLRAMRARSGEKEVILEHVQAALDVLGGLSAAAEVPACRVELRGKKLVLLEQRASGGSGGNRPK
jgi:tRNA(Ile)-lysidine synthase